MLEKINLAECLSRFDEHWSPRIVGELNDSYLKLAKLKGEFVWHHHENEDELFVVLKGELLIKYRDGRRATGGSSARGATGGSSASDSDSATAHCQQAASGTLREIRLRPGECLIIPRGTEHLPIAENEVHLMLIEPKTTRNTGNINNERTVCDPERL